MFSFLYNGSLLLLALSALPKFLWDFFVYGKHKESIKTKLGMSLPLFSKKQKDFVIWIHAISVGETRAAIPLFQKIKEKYPFSKIAISSTTETGHKEAKKSMKEADAHFFLPLDFSWSIKKAIKRISPNILILIEGDFWYHLLHYAKQENASIFVVNGKVSEKSANRFSKFAFFTNRLFKDIDFFCLQNEQYKKRFLKLGVQENKIAVTGNLKLNIEISLLSKEEKNSWRKVLGIADKAPVITIGSSHSPEEEWLLSALDIVWRVIPDLKVLLVPRHPERFKEVEEYLKKWSLPMIPYSKISQKTGHERIVLIDAMGMLPKLYALSDLAIVGGSFKDGIGGHNIFEPVQVGCYVFFGPHMFGQKDLVELIIEARAGEQIKLQDLPEKILFFLQNQNHLQNLQKNCLSLAKSTRGALDRTCELLFSRFEKKND